MSNVIDSVSYDQYKNIYQQQMKWELKQKLYLVKKRI